MNEDLLQLIQDFATKEHTEINQSLFNKGQMTKQIFDHLTSATSNN